MSIQSLYGACAQVLSNSICLIDSRLSLGNADFVCSLSTTHHLQKALDETRPMSLEYVE